MPDEQKIRVLFYLFFPAGGIGKYTHRLLEEMQGHPELDIEVACLPEYQWRDNPAYCTWPHLFSISHRIPAIRKFRFLVGQFVNPIRLLSRAREFRADIVHFCNINHLSFPCWKGFLGSGIKVVCTAHDVRRSHGIVCLPWEQRQLKAFYRRCDALFVHTESQAADIRNYSGVAEDRVHIVPHGPYGYAPLPSTGVRELRRKYGIPENRTVGLVFGQVRPEKNTDAVIHALALSQSDVHLVIAGKEASVYTGLFKSYEKLIENLNLSNRVTLINRYILDQEVPELCAASDWLAAPYRPSFTSESGVLHMAAFYRKPVLVTPCFAELMARAPVGVLARGFNDADLAQAMDELTKQVGAGAEYDFDTYNRCYSWATNASTTIQVYKGLVKAGVCAND